MKKNRISRFSISTTVLLLSLIPLMLPAATASEEVREAKPLAEMSVGAGRVDWQPAGDYEHLTLTVAGPAGIWIRKEFTTGQPASLSLYDPEWERLPDGSYTWELRATPHPSNLRQRPLVASGHLSVRNGSFVAVRKRVPATSKRPPWV